ncbi:hypothetical protein N7457_002896 [Penicillium paradoxum]|uniref:uncharacterized protein n=1 Tax=Penicillium paradoxum TaxID=176176 RepID=UPI0025468F87|nr:uncharacterized protein N7457_002896 [Penicillium paradoxum]KAJ5787906.1 hypothetical protein N7457_002896 [Penicillium paradoxum]
MTIQACALPRCTKPGLWACSACEPPKAWYCSRECQKADFKVHKRTCAPTTPYNCFIIRASPATGADQSIMARIEPFPLQSYGDWVLEMKEIQEKLGWPEAIEAGKFYPPNEDIDTWYYYAYKALDFPQRPENELATRCLGPFARGDVVVVRSSPVGIEDYDELFTKMDVKKAIEYCKTASSEKVFQDRERSRLTKNLRMPPDFLKGVPTVNINL